MRACKVTEKIYALHADIETDELFEGIWPIPEGVSLNSYLVKGETSCALVDLVRDWCKAPDELCKQLASINASIEDIDYLILNHMEPDHTGWLAEFRKLNPKVTIVATAKALELVKSFYKVTENLRPVKSGDSLDLGGLKLVFEEAPNLHWPETMVTFEPESGTLFSCDAFGSFGKLTNRIFDDEYYSEDLKFFEDETLRYYANIIASFGLFVKRAIEKLTKLDIKIVAPSHGLIWREKPMTIINRYLKYANYMEGPREKEVCVVWGSMYGNTREGLEYVLKGLEDEHVPYTMFKVPEDDVSFVLAEAYRCEGVIMAMPTYEYKMFPPMAYVIDVFERKHIWNRKALRVGSFGWVGGAQKDYDNRIAPLKWDHVEPLEWAGLPDEAMGKQLRERGRELARRIKG